MIDRFLTPADAERACRALTKRARHNLSSWALTGGLAVEIHLHGVRQHSIRRLSDVDFAASGFECIPETLARDYLFRHVHPNDPPGKTMMQLVDPDAALRIDVFRARVGTMSRAVRACLPSGPVNVVSIEDSVALKARVLLDLAEGEPVEPKHASDYARLVALADPSKVEAAWQDHRRPTHPLRFDEAGVLIRNLVAARSDRLIVADYSRDGGEVCRRCVRDDRFPLADPRDVFSLLGYA